MTHKNISKFLSLILRHKPEVLGISLDKEGWVSVAELLDKMQQKGMLVDLQQLQEVVDTNDKKRYSFSADGTKIRANQGHSLAVELGLEPLAPPAVLYHGTAIQNISSILKEGLERRTRQHVHLSQDSETARKVGQRHGKPVILLIRSEQMHREGHLFYHSANGVWLTNAVPPKFIELKDEN